MPIRPHLQLLCWDGIFDGPSLATGTQYIWVDWIAIRKHTDTEPTFTGFEAEEFGGSASASPSVSPSLSPSPSPSVSPSQSPSLSPSASLSPSVSPSLSPSASLSPSVSPSSSPSLSPVGARLRVHPFRQVDHRVSHQVCLHRSHFLLLCHLRGASREPISLPSLSPSESPSLSPSLSPSDHHLPPFCQP